MLSLVLDKLESVQRPNAISGTSNFQDVSEHLLQQRPYFGVFSAANLHLFIVNSGDTKLQVNFADKKHNLYY